MKVTTTINTVHGPSTVFEGNAKFRERDVPVRTVEVHFACPQCERGMLIYTQLKADHDLYHHRCDSGTCGRVYALGAIYPRVEHRRD